MIRDAVEYVDRGSIAPRAEASPEPRPSHYCGQRIHSVLCEAEQLVMSIIARETTQRQRILCSQKLPAPSVDDLLLTGGDNDQSWSPRHAG